jgi:hypothetical protein
MESRKSSESQSALPYCGLPTQVLLAERAEKRLYATLRDGTSALPLEYVSANHRRYSKRHRSALGKWLQPARSRGKDGQQRRTGRR